MSNSTSNAQQPEPLFQVLRLTVQNPATNQTQTIDFLGPAIVNAEEWEKMKADGITLGDIIKDIQLGNPETPLQHIDLHPEMQELHDGITELKSQYETLTQPTEDTNL